MGVGYTEADRFRFWKIMNERPIFVLALATIEVSHDCFTKPLMPYLVPKYEVYPYSVKCPRTISLWRDFLCWWHLVKLLWDNPLIDLVHTQTAKAGFLGRLAAWWVGIPCVHTVHAWPFHSFQSRWRQWVYWRLERLAAGWCTLIACDSRTVRATSLQAGWWGRQVRTVPLGVDLARWTMPTAEERATARAAWGATDQTFIFGVAARLVPQKGLPFLLHLCAHRSFNAICPILVMIGSGELESPLRRLAIQLRIDAWVRWMPWMADVRVSLCGLDCYVSPTQREGFGMSVAEAVAMNIPCVVSRLGPFEEWLLPGQSGQAFPMPPQDEWHPTERELHEWSECLRGVRLNHYYQFTGLWKPPLSRTNLIHHDLTIAGWAKRTACLYEDALMRDTR